MTQATLLILFLVFEAAVVAGILVMVLHIVSVRRAIGGDSHKGGKAGWKLNALPGAALNSMRDLLGSQPEQTKKIKEENIELARQVIHLQEDLEESVKVLERTKLELDESRRESIKAKQDTAEGPEAQALLEKDEAEQLLEDAGQPEAEIESAEGDGVTEGEGITEAEGAEADSFWDEAEEAVSDAGEPVVAEEDEGEENLWDEAESLAPDAAETAAPEESIEVESSPDGADRVAPDASEPGIAYETTEEDTLWDQDEQEGDGQGDLPDTPASQAPAQPSPGSPDGENLAGETEESGDEEPGSDRNDTKSNKSYVPDEDLDYEVLEITLPGDESNTP